MDENAAMTDQTKKGSAVMSQTPVADERKPTPVNWYRSPLATEMFKRLHERSDALGLAQALGFLVVLLATGGLAFYSVGRWPVPMVVALVFLHGMVTAFLINGVHELCHNTVFKTPFLNALFMRIFSFLGWINFEMFQVSHARHHRYTLHPPDDLEVVLPIQLMIRHFFLRGFVHPLGAWHTIKDTIRIARGRLRGPWELTLFPSSDPARRKPPIRWARTLLIGHGLILAGAAVTGLWMLPVLGTFAPVYGGWLSFLCNGTQHIGLQDNVPDFRLCCRTFTLNPVVQFLYWHMNHHTEHHMYAAVPCYRLGQLHAAIRHDLPPCSHGLVATWKEIVAIQKIQKTNPGYQHVASLPVVAVG